MDAFDAFFLTFFQCIAVAALLGGAIVLSIEAAQFVHAWILRTNHVRAGVRGTLIVLTVTIMIACAATAAH